MNQVTRTKKVLEAFWCWLDSLTVLKGSTLGKAVIYAKNQKQYMENYLLNGRCSLSNNAAENAIRPFTIGRKNWLFSDRSKGATASGLNVYTYLEYLLLYMPDTDWSDLNAFGRSVSSPYISQANCYQVSYLTSTLFLVQRKRPWASICPFIQENESIGLPQKILNSITAFATKKIKCAPA